MTKFVITGKFLNGDEWETTRHTKEGMEVVVRDVLKDMSEVTDEDRIASFSVEEVRI